MNIRAARFEWKVAANRFARKTGLHDRKHGYPLQRADFTPNFRVIFYKDLTSALELNFQVPDSEVYKFC